MKKTFKTGAWLPVAAAGVLLAGCAANQPKPLYQWGGYQPQVYEYFKGQKSPEDQIDALEKALQQIRAKGNRPPPGFEAHLGMLYASVGKEQQAEQSFQAEKASFPESSPFMDFLLKKKAAAPQAKPSAPTQPQTQTQTQAQQ
ncbi:DUF4810 domain-containing protein [Burkholderia pseudomallei]|uniref:DUF4810 domain-containing protein n=1 Tax=Burkholderia pseudomallei TaxID=28450 RepID=UPI00294A7D13|nr:DUF4810 domain-containing protein [Burkholderia pseudomallei]CAJ9606086.1 lipoprotein [Burkholderia pseudomallei]